MKNTKRIAEYENFINGQEQVIQMLNRITQRHADMNVEEFVEMCIDTKKQLVALKTKPKTIGNIERRFQEHAIDLMDDGDIDDNGTQFWELDM
jgi:hypothetical protein